MTAPTPDPTPATLYTLGQLVRACWPAGDAPQTLHDLVPARPATGLAEIHRRRGPFGPGDDRARLIGRLPAGLADPADPVAEARRAPYWLGYHHYALALRAADQLGPEDLARVGEALYGARWQTALTDALGLGDSARIRQWLKSKRPIPATVWADLLRLLQDRQLAIEETLWGLTTADARTPNRA